MESFRLAEWNRMGGRHYSRLKRLLQLTVLFACAWEQSQGQDSAWPHFIGQPTSSAPKTELLPAASPSGRLTLQELERLALTHNPSIARFQAAVQGARGNWVQVGLLPDPTVGYEGQQLGSGGLAEQHGIAVGQEFVLRSKLLLNRDVASKEITRATQQLAAQQQRVITDVRIGFYEVLLAQRQLEIVLDIERIAQNGAQAAEKLFTAQEVSRIDVLQSQLELENAQILTRNAQNRYQAAWQSLVAVLGLPAMTPQPVEGDVESGLDTLEWQTTLERVLTCSPEVAAAAATVERSRSSLERARVEPRPNLNVEAVYNVVDNGINGDDANIMVRLPVPVWNRNQGAISQAQADVIAAERAFDQLMLKLHRELAPVFERYSNAKNQVERYRATILPTAKETLQLSQRSYEVGETGFVNLLTVQRTFAQTNLNYLQSLRELRVAEAELDGLLLRDSLSATEK